MVFTVLGGCMDGVGDGVNLEGSIGGIQNNNSEW